MTARIHFPEPLKGIKTSQLKKVIEETNLGAQDTKIAKLRYLNHLALAEIGAIVGLDRSAVGRHLGEINKKIIETFPQNPVNQA